MFGLDDYTSTENHNGMPDQLLQRIVEQGRMIVALQDRIQALDDFQNMSLRSQEDLQNKNRKLKKRVKELEKACQMSDAIITEILHRLTKLEETPDMSIDPLWEDQKK